MRATAAPVTTEPTLATVTLRSHRTPDQESVILDALREIAAEQARQRDTLAAIVRLLERNRGARDQADVALLVAIVEAIGDREFTSAQLLAHAEANLALREAIEAADITNAQELGCVFRRMEGMMLAGVRLAHVRDERAGAVWLVQVCEG